MIRLRVVGSQDLREFVPAFRAVYQAAYRHYIARAEKRAKGNLSGGVLAARTGASARAARGFVEVHGLVMRGGIQSDHPAAAAHEFGATIPARVIRPVRARVLHWIEGGDDVFAMIARPGAFKLPARPWAGPALEVEVPAFTAELEAGLDRLVQAAARRRGGR